MNIMLKFLLGYFVLLGSASVQRVASVGLHCVGQDADAKEPDCFLVYNERISWFAAHARCHEQQLELVSDPPAALLEAAANGSRARGALFYINAHRTWYSSSAKWHTKTLTDFSDVTRAGDPALSDGRPLRALAMHIASKDLHESTSSGKNCFAIEHSTGGSRGDFGNTVKAISCAKLPKSDVGFACRLKEGRNYNRRQNSAWKSLQIFQQCPDNWERAEYPDDRSELLGLPICARVFRVAGDMWDVAKSVCKHAEAELFAPSNDLEGQWFEHWAAATERLEGATAVFVDAHQNHYCEHDWCWRNGRAVNSSSSSASTPLKWSHDEPNNQLYREHCAEYEPRSRDSAGGLRDILCDTPAHLRKGRGVAVCVRELDLQPHWWIFTRTGLIVSGVIIILLVSFVALLVYRIARGCRHRCSGHFMEDELPHADEATDSAQSSDVHASAAQPLQPPPYREEAAPPHYCTAAAASSRKSSSRSAASRRRSPRAPDWMDSMKSLYDTSSSSSSSSGFAPASVSGLRQGDAESLDENNVSLQFGATELTALDSPPRRQLVLTLNALDRF